jgi:hypothetical protein
VKNETSTIYESWDLSGPSIPARSSLYHLEPIGIGTGSVESLTSYVSRLAAAHCMSPAVLMARKLIPVIGKKYWLRAKKSPSTRSSILGNSFSLPAKVVNGRGIIAQDWVSALQGLTLCDNLSLLTMLPWAEVLPQRNLLRTTKAWCADCYTEWRANNQIVYEPLIWTFLSLQVCVKHRRPLRSQCPHCGNKLPWLSRCGQPGYCSKCDEWLGAELHEPSINIEGSSAELQWQTWVTTNLEQLISSAVHHRPSSNEKIATALSMCINKTSNGVMNRFARLIDKSKTTVWGWQHGQTQIAIDDLLRICNHVGISLVDFLHAKVLALNEIESISIPRLGSGENAIRRPARPLDRTAIDNALRAILKEQTPLPMRAAAEKLGINKRVLYRHFPKLCKAISARHKQQQQAYRHDRKSQLQKEISETKTQLRAIGIYPSRRRVARIIRSQKLCTNRFDDPLIRDLQIAA